MSEKIYPIGLSFIANRYNNSDLVKHAPKSTAIIDNTKYCYGGIFEKSNPEMKRLYSLEENGKVRGLFEAVRKEESISLTSTKDGGCIEKLKIGLNTLYSKYSKKGIITDLVEESADGVTFLSKNNVLTSLPHKTGKIKLQQIIECIKVI